MVVFALSQQEWGLFGVGSMKCINQQLWMQIGSQSFFHITPGNNNAEMVGQPGHAITDHECPPAVWAAGELVKEHFQISAV